MIDIISRKLATLASTNALSALKAAATNTESPTLLGSPGNGTSPSADQAAWQATVTAILNSLSTAPTGNAGWTSYQTGALIEPGIYDVGNLTLSGHVKLIAKIPGSVIIRIPAGQYFATINGTVDSLQVDGITFIGGLGAFDFVNATGNNVALMHCIERCFFFNYTQCAIAGSGADYPYMRFADNVFMGLSGSSTRAISWGGNDRTIIEGNAFLRNQYDLVIGPGLFGVYIQNNDFISFGGTAKLADIWLRAENTANDFGLTMGFGAVISDNKFGNENQTLTSPRLLVALADPAQSQNTQDCVPTTTDAGYLGAFSFLNNRIAGLTGITAPFMQSHITNLPQVLWRNNKFDGGGYPYVIYFTNGITSANALGSCVFEFRHNDLRNGDAPPRAFSNGLFAELLDYAGWFPGDANAQDVYPLGDGPGLSLLGAGLCQAQRALTGSATRVKTADLSGGTDYDSVTCPTSGAGISVSLSGVPAAGGKGFIEMVLGQAATRSLSRVRVNLYNNGSAANLWTQYVNLPASPGRVVIPVNIPPSAYPGNWSVTVTPSGFSDYVAGTSDSFVAGDIVANLGTARYGRDRALAKYPVFPRNRRMLGATPSTLPTGWTINYAGGLVGVSAAVTNMGYDANGDYIEVTLSGTATAAGRVYIVFEPAQSVPVNNTQTWMWYSGVTLVSGTMTGFATVAGGIDGSSGRMGLYMPAYNGTTYEADFVYGFTPTNTYGLYGSSSFTGFPGSTNNCLLQFRIDIPVTVAPNAVLRLYVPTVRRLI